MLKKKKIKEALQQLILEKIDFAEKALQQTIESRDSEDKSSAGDKYETGRAMMQIEQQQKEIQLTKAIQLKNSFEQINFDKTYLKVETGTLVQTEKNYLFFGLGLGKFLVEKKEVFALSLASPLGLLFLDKKKEDVIEFRDKRYQILELG